MDVTSAQTIQKTIDSRHRDLTYDWKTGGSPLRAGHSQVGPWETVWLQHEQRVKDIVEIGTVHKNL